MFDTVYVEKEVASHPRVQRILSKISPLRVIPIDRYGEIFNRKGQNFRTQKRKPSLILAKKYGEFLHPIPPAYSIGQKRNFYFSHIFNCPFDCSYCYLQGMFRSAHFVLFINFEEMAEAIEKNLKESEDMTCFFSGYDADSLALDSLSGFLSFFLPFFANHPKGFLEIRTKSIAVKQLLQIDPIPNCEIAYTLSPSSIVKEYEPKTPPLKKRIEALQSLQSHGWKIGFRLDPVIPVEEASTIYKSFFEDLFHQISPNRVNSVTLGVFRLPKSYYKNMKKINAATTLLPIVEEKKGMMAAAGDELLQQELKSCLEQYISTEKLFVI